MKIDRRRLLKGSLAAPVVLTVRPASAIALTSATACLHRCEVAAQEKNPPKMSPSKNGDEWMRVEVEECRLAPSAGKDFYGGKYFLGFDQYTYWRLDDRNPYAWPARPSSHTKGSCYAQKTGVRMYGIAYIDGNGKVGGFAWENQNYGSPVTWSCYTSAIGMKQKV